MTAFEMTLTPLQAGLPAEKPQDLEVLVRLRGPQSSASGPPRQPLNLALVLDRSGSMHGRPLAEAVRCARFVIDNLAADDVVSLVVYDQDIDILVPSRPVGDRHTFHAALQRVCSGGSTALFDGWRQGAEMALVTEVTNGVNRVLLLSDGEANVGLTAVEDIVPHCAAFADRNITTSTYGLGHGFNEALMVAMAEAGRGNSYYGETAEDLMDPFREEFDLLTSLCARNLRLFLRGADGVSVEVLNRFKRGPGGCRHLPDLAYGGEVWALARLHFDERWAGVIMEGAEVPVLTASVAFTDCTGGQDREATAILRLPVLSARRHADLGKDESVLARASELRFASLQEQAGAAARRDDWMAVQSLLDEAEAESGDHAWLLESLRELRQHAKDRHVERFAKETAYKSAKLRSRLVDVNEQVECFDLDVEASKPTFLRRKLQQGKVLKYQAADLSTENVNALLEQAGHAADDREDPQQLAVYAWQARHGCRDGLGWLEPGQVRELVDDLSGQFGIPVPRISFQDWDFPISGYETDDHSLVFVRRWVNAYMVEHEMAHAITHKEHGLAVQGHGPEFVANLVRVMSHGDAVRERELKRSAEAAGLLGP